MIAARRKPEPLGSFAKQTQGEVVGLSDHFHEVGGAAALHADALEAECGEAGELDVARRRTRAATSAEPSRGGGLIRSAAETEGTSTTRSNRSISGPDRRRGTGRRSARWGALAGVAGLVGRAAAARIHGRDELEPRRIDDPMVGARDGDLARLDRLAQAVESLRLELGQFVQEQNAVVGERNLAGPRMGAAADERRHRGRMVRRPERPAVGQGAARERPAIE